MQEYTNERTYGDVDFEPSAEKKAIKLDIITEVYPKDAPRSSVHLHS